MTAQLFPNLPEQREGPITVDGRTLAQCVSCRGTGFGDNPWSDPDKAKFCVRCNGGGVVLVRA